MIEVVVGGGICQKEEAEAKRKKIEGLEKLGTTYYQKSANLEAIN